MFPDYELGDDREKDVRLYERTHQRSKKERLFRHRQMEEIFQNIPRHQQKLSGKRQSIGIRSSREFRREKE